MDDRENFCAAVGIFGGSELGVRSVVICARERGNSKHNQSYYAEYVTSYKNYIMGFAGKSWFAAHLKNLLCYGPGTGGSLCLVGLNQIDKMRSAEVRVKGWNILDVEEPGETAPFAFEQQGWFHNFMPDEYNPGWCRVGFLNHVARRLRVDK